MKSGTGILLTLIPFMLFIAGYYGASLFVGVETGETPDLVGRTMTQVITLLAPYQVHFSLLGEVEDGSLPEGTVLSQRPQPGQRMKRYQSIGLVVSKKPASLRAPLLVGSTFAEVHTLLERQAIKAKYWYLASKYPANTCIAQCPIADDILQEKHMDVYISSGAPLLCVLPDFRGATLAEVTAFIAPYGMSLSIFPSELSSHRDCSDCVVTAQRPLPGSAVNMNHLPQLQVSVRHA